MDIDNIETIENAKICCCFSSSSSLKYNIDSNDKTNTIFHFNSNVCMKKKSRKAVICYMCRLLSYARLFINDRKNTHCDYYVCVSKSIFFPTNNAQ